MEAVGGGGNPYPQLNEASKIFVFVIVKCRKGAYLFFPLLSPPLPFTPPADGCDLAYWWGGGEVVMGRSRCRPTRGRGGNNMGMSGNGNMGATN